MNLREFFYFRRSDRHALLFLLSVVVVALMVIYFVSSHSSAGDSIAGDSLTVSSWQSQKAYDRRQQYVGELPSGRQIELFDFDPNTADSTQLLRLGFSPWQVRNIYKYRAAGGVYQKPSDLARLYGLTAGHYRQLQPYIHIADEFRSAREVYDEVLPTQRRDTARYVVKARPGEQVALNTADTTSLKCVPGIGSYYARQVVWYREQLGGYVDVSQLREIEGFPLQSMSYFVVDKVPLRKIKINTATLNQLKRHPYINFYQARDIVDYRRLKKPLNSLGELRLLKDFTPSDIERLAPYVEF